jgi:hypothetical protein
MSCHKPEPKYLILLYSLLKNWASVATMWKSKPPHVQRTYKEDPRDPSGPQGPRSQESCIPPGPRVPPVDVGSMHSKAFQQLPPVANSVSVALRRSGCEPSQDHLIKSISLYIISNAEFLITR